MNLRFGTKMHMVVELTGDMDVCTLAAVKIDEKSVVLLLVQGDRVFPINGAMGFGDYFNGEGLKIFDEYSFGRAVELSNAIKANKNINIGQEVFYCDPFEVGYCGKVETFSNNGNNVVIIDSNVSESDADYMHDIKIKNITEFHDYFLTIEAALENRNGNVMGTIEAAFKDSGLRCCDIDAKTKKDAEMMDEIQALWSAIYRRDA